MQNIIIHSVHQRRLLLLGTAAEARSHLNEEINDGAKGQGRACGLIRGVRERGGRDVRLALAGRENEGDQRLIFWGHLAWLESREVNEVMKGSPEATWVLLCTLPREVTYQQV